MAMMKELFLELDNYDDGDGYYPDDDNDCLTYVVIGAAGRIGLPFSVHLANLPGVAVIGVDSNSKRINELSTSSLDVGFIEKDLEFGLEEAFLDQSLFLTDNGIDYIPQADIIFICVGTPLNGDGTLDHSNIEKLVFNDILPYAKKGSHVIIKSTVEVGFTEKMNDLLNTKPYSRFKNFTLWYCPERVVEGNALEEFATLPVILGYTGDDQLVPDMDMYPYFKNYIVMSSTEAEFLKAATNMKRYVDMAFTNEMMMRADNYGIDYNEVFNYLKFDYPRMNSLMAPGINSNGPCLMKDGAAFFNNDMNKLYFSDLVRVAKETNTTRMVSFVASKIMEYFPQRKESILLMGEAFKPDIDDTRDSITPMIKELLLKLGYRVDVFDPIVYPAQRSSNLRDYDCYFVVTPHTIFKEIYYPLIKKTGKVTALFMDFWGAYENIRSNMPVDEVPPSVRERNNI